VKIINKTNYDTKTLRAMVKLVASEELDPGQLKFMHITFMHKNARGARNDRWNRRIYPIGAGLKYNRFNVTLRKETNWLGREPLDWPATMLAHEFAECRGKRHADMKGGSSRYGYGKKGSYWGKRLKEAGIRLNSTSSSARPSLPSQQP
jgi:hypothetical protein